MTTMKTLILYFKFIVLSLWMPDTTALQDVTLTSTLTDGLVAYNEQEVVFTCITRYSNILQWSSNEYISSDGLNIQVYNGTLGTDVRRGSAHAILVRATIENGVIVLESELRIRVSTLHPTATVQCDNNGHGARQNITFALQNVTLTSTLTDGLVAYGGQEVVFTCITRYSNILQWSSDEYISSDGHNIQIYNGTLGTDVRRGNAHAILVRATVENGVRVLVSELRIRVSTLHTTATVQCDNNGHGSRQSITFALQNVTLTSTLTDGLVAYGGQEVVFTCVTRNSNILQWSSNEYISNDGHNIQVYDGTLGTDVRRGSAHAILVQATIENGVRVLVSELRVRVSTLHPTATLQCDNNGHGERQSITFNSVDPPIPRVNSTLTEGMYACPGNKIHFECTTTGSQNLSWTSDDYIRSGVPLHFLYNSTTSILEESSGTFAMLMDRTIDRGRITLTSRLIITVLDSIRERSHSITCLSVDVGTSITISFQLAEVCEESTTITTSTKPSVESGNNDNSKGNLPTKVLLAVIIPVVAAGLLVFTISVLLFWRLKGQSNKIGCMKDETQSQYEAKGTCNKEKPQVYQAVPSTSPSSSTLSSENKSVPNSESTSSSLIAGSVGSAQGDHEPASLSKHEEAAEEVNISTSKTRPYQYDSTTQDENLSIV